MVDKDYENEIAYTLKKYFTILILTFLLFSTFFMLLFNFSIYFLNDSMSKENYAFLSLLLYILYLVAYLDIVEVLSKDKKKEEEEKWK